LQDILSNTLWPRSVILAWLTAWMLAVPLVHVHPEADHHHDQLGHVHGGASHTVFSSDLPCEFASREGQAAAHALDHPEIAFSLLASSGDRSGGKPIVVAASTWGAEGDIVLFPSAFHDLSADTSHPSVLRSAALSTRAPPVLSL